MLQLWAFLSYCNDSVSNLDEMTLRAAWNNERKRTCVSTKSSFQSEKCTNDTGVEPAQMPILVVDAEMDASPDVTAKTPSLNFPLKRITSKYQQYMSLYMTIRKAIDCSTIFTG